MSAIDLVRLDGFDDPAFPPERWNALLGHGDVNEVFLTWHWQKAWWESFGRGRLLLLLARRGGEDVALAPLFVDSAMIYFVGSGGSDFLGFVGDVSDPLVLEALLSAAREQAGDFQGFVFYHVPDYCGVGAALRQAAPRLDLACRLESRMAAPALDIAADPEAAHATTRKKSLVRHENGLARQGPVALRALTDPEELEPNLELLFAQHVARWATTPHPSLFLDPRQRDFYRRLVRAGHAAGWLRFARLDWDGRPVAFHLGFLHAGSFLWYKPSYDVALARMSPGEVLLRRLLLSAIEEGAARFDFGIGDEAFKQRFANRSRAVESWAIDPS